MVTIQFSAMCQHAFDVVKKIVAVDEKASDSSKIFGSKGDLKNLGGHGWRKAATAAAKQERQTAKAVQKALAVDSRAKTAHRRSCHIGYDT